MNLVFLGPPGAGKGTQARVVAQKLGVRHLSTGDLLRAALRVGTEVGHQAKMFMDRGQLVPDELVTRLLAIEVNSDPASPGFLLDGYPRTLEQGRSLDAILDAASRNLTGVLFIDVPDEVLVRRLSGRQSCAACGAMYHVEFNPARTSNVCDGCGGKLSVRDDDQSDVVRERLVVYARDTRPLLDFYSGRDLLLSVDGSGSVEAVQDEILRVLRVA